MTVFWDDKCSQNQEKACCVGLDNASIIILLISPEVWTIPLFLITSLCTQNKIIKVLQKIRDTAYYKQDNVLIQYQSYFLKKKQEWHQRYEGALLKNKSPQKTSVLPVFIGSKKREYPVEFERFSIGTEAPFPSLSHERNAYSNVEINTLRYFLLSSFLFISFFMTFILYCND